MKLDSDGQPVVKGFNYSRNVDKSFRDLLGLCKGMICDRRLNETEVLALDIWLKNNQILENDPDYIDLVDIVGDILEDGHISEDELIDLKRHIYCVLRYREDIDIDDPDDALGYLIGILRGIVADSVLRETEIRALGAWLRKIDSISNHFAVRRISDRIEQILEDGIVDDDEKQDLLSILEMVVGSDFSNGVVSGLSSRLPVDDIVEVEIREKTFCLTGKFSFGSRTKCETAIRALGGITTNNVTTSIDYLVIGTFASRDWAHTSIGRKIEKAIEYKEKGHKILIAFEDHLPLRN